MVFQGACEILWVFHYIIQGLKVYVGIRQVGVER